jgi:hypothetical protein
MQEVLLSVFCIFTQFVHLVSSIKSPLFDHHLWNSLQVFKLKISTIMSDECYKHAKKWCWTKLYGLNPLYPTETWITSSCARIWFFHSWTCLFFRMHHHFNFTWSNLEVFYSNSTSNPFLLVVTHLPIPTTSSPWTLTLSQLTTFAKIDNVRLVTS